MDDDTRLPGLGGRRFRLFLHGTQLLPDQLNHIFEETVSVIDTVISLTSTSLLGTNEIGCFQNTSSSILHIVNYHP